MKTIVRTDDAISIYLFDDEAEITLFNTQVVIGNAVNLIIADCNSDNVVVYEGVTAPEDWRGWKYTFDGSEWALNPDYIDPVLPQ